MSAYNKTITAIVTALVGWTAAVIGSASAEITATEWHLGFVALVTALGVYAVPNQPD